MFIPYPYMIIVVIPSTKYHQSLPLLLLLLDLKEGQLLLRLVHEQPVLRF